MKKRSILFLIVLMFVVLVTFSGCVYNYSGSSSNNNSSNGGNSSGTNDTRYVLDNPYVEPYSEVGDNDVAVKVADIVMKATLEITCTVNFEYTYQSRWGYYGQNQTVSSSQSGQATGFVINEDGYVMTNAHVVTIENESSYPNLKYTSRVITLNYADSDAKFSAEVVDYDTTLDLAILKMDTTNIENLQYVTFFDLSDPRTENISLPGSVNLYYGETAIAIGNANGYGISITKGVVSAPIRVFNDNGVLEYAIQTDAAINSGNSGGPLCNAFAAVIGINSFKIVTSSTSESLGYAIPSYVVLKYIDDYNTESSSNIKYYTTTQRVYK